MKLIKSKIFILFTILIIFQSCAENKNYDNSFEMDEVISLKFNQSALNRADNMDILFSDIISESRCPMDAQCFIPGKAEIEIVCYWDTFGSKTVILRINDYVDNKNGYDPQQHITVDTLGFKFTLLQLDPYPDFNIDKEYQEEEYEAIIKISKNEDD